jgi:hypothetical protein
LRCSSAGLRCSVCAAAGAEFFPQSRLLTEAARHSGGRLPFFPPVAWAWSKVIASSLSILLAASCAQGNRIKTGGINTVMCTFEE